MKKMDHCEEGSFQVGGTLMISDPCYGGEWSVPAKPGNWIGQAKQMSRDSGTGKLKAVHSQYKDRFRAQLKTETKEVSVDSGQMSIFDPFVAMKFGGTRDDFLYRQICDITYPVGIIGVEEENFGVASSSGYGDGGYEAKVWFDEQGLAVAVEVDFEGEEDYEECLHCGDDADTCWCYDEEDEEDES